MTILKLSLQTLNTVISPHLTWHSDLCWEAYIAMLSMMFARVKIMAWHFGSSTCCTVRTDEKRGNVAKCFGHGEKWLVQMSPWLVYLLGYQAVLAHLTKHE